jgi:2',3'-cyclic-nucleotide 2'-phosphodiesterase (5'-nucleotidase family)
MFHGTPVSNIFHGKPVMDVMNALGFDALAVGNHEFDWGLETLRALGSSAQFPFLSANVVDSNGRNLSGIRPYVILRKKGVTIAVIGVTTTETPYITKPGRVNGLRFLNPEETMPRLITEVKNKGASVVVLLSHLGLDADKALAKNVAGIDAIVGGHSHTALKEPVRVGNTVIVQAGCNGLYLGVVELAVKSGGLGSLVTVRNGGLRLVSAGPNDRFDKRIMSMVSAYSDPIKAKFAQVVGEAKVDLVRRSYGESNLGDLIADAMRESSGSQIAFQNSGGIRTDLPTGKITLEQLYTTLPFDDAIISMDLTGKDLLEILEQSGSMEYGLLQTSGLNVVYDMAKPAGQRVANVLIGGSPLDPLKIYRVAMNDFLAVAGDRFSAFTRGKNFVSGDGLKDVVVLYLKKHSPVDPTVEGRSVIVK